MDIRDKCRGAFFGLAIGDALGAPVEFRQRGSFPWVKDYQDGGPFNLRAGDWTDDTSMAIATAHGLVNGGTVASVRNEFIAWMMHGKHSVNGRCFDIGSTCRAAINSGKPQCDNWSQGNGGIMRLAPIPIFFRNDGYLYVEKMSAYFTGDTHGNIVCLEAASVLGGYLIRLIKGVAFDRVVGSVSNITTSEIKAINNPDWIKETDYSELRNTGYVVDTIKSAIYCVSVASCFDEAVQLAVNLGGDSDTIGAVAGQLAGARWGYRKIPARLIGGLQKWDLVNEAFESIFD